MDIPQLTPTFAMVAGRAGRHNIGPDMFSAHVFGKNMVHGQLADVTPAVLAGEVITAKNLPAGQLDLQAWTVNHLIQANNRWPRQGLFHGLDIAASIHHHVGFPGKDQANGATGIAHINWLEIGVKY